MLETPRQIVKFIATFETYGRMGQADELFWATKEFNGLYAETDVNRFKQQCSRGGMRCIVSKYVGGILQH